jgi:hypothetical protein
VGEEAIRLVGTQPQCGWIKLSGILPNTLTGATTKNQVAKRCSYYFHHAQKLVLDAFMAEIHFEILFYTHHTRFRLSFISEERYADGT